MSANSNENYTRYNFQVFVNISRNFEKISGNIKFSEYLQPQLLHLVHFNSLTRWTFSSDFSARWNTMMTKNTFKSHIENMCT